MDKDKIPKHIAIIMDGNGRWARKRGLPHLLGHARGAKTVDKITEECARLGVKALTLYSFSAENWKRSDEEIDGLMNLLSDYLDKKFKKLQKNNISLHAIGRLDELPAKVGDSLKVVIRKTRDNTRMKLVLALNYGGRQEITDAARSLAADVKNKKLILDCIDEDIFARYLYTGGLPELDLLIRTSGEMRLSNFLLWQSSYAEIVITKTLWPDFNKKDLHQAIRQYQSRERRYGGR